nr:transposase [Verrucomicrobium spinosum]
MQGLGGFCQGVGGINDHVHLLIGLKPTHCLSDFMRELKKASSIWVHQEVGLGHFAWQEGYSAFSVSALHGKRSKSTLHSSRSIIG